MNERKRIEKTRDEIVAEGVILCVRLGAGVPVVDLCRAAARGGVRVLEITLTTPGAVETIAALSSDAGIIVGGGTVLTVDDARAVAGAGGRFAFSPVFDPAVIDESHRLGLLAVPGAGSATEIHAAHRHGALLVKIFPAGALGGPAFVRAVRGPLPGVPLVPTSGPSSETMRDYFDAGAVAVGVGAEVFPSGRGFTPESVETAARRVREAVDRARSRS